MKEGGGPTREIVSGVFNYSSSYFNINCNYTFDIKGLDFGQLRGLSFEQLKDTYHCIGVRSKENLD